IIIAILGEDPFGAYFDTLVKDEKIRDRPLMLRRFARLEDVTDCHILYVSRSEVPRYDRIIAQLKGRPVLTVGDADNFAKQGGMVRFATENGRTQLRVNVTAVKAANLTISSKLLAHVTIVTPGKD
ncbi:MAG: YfiR family protein, partial [Verrucomicrobia bacterium]|nr:YfiR family protein [Verrucomicrobiota bacterium]